jgi:UDP-glucose 4-epimerase
MTTVAVTGTHGFVGSALTGMLERRGIGVTRLDRALLMPPARAQLSRAMEGCDAVIHCAGLTPRRGQRFDDAEFDLVNHQLTKNVAQAVADANVPRLLYLSSIAAVGAGPAVLAPSSPQHPVGAYGKSKADAEAALLSMAVPTTLIVRPPLVYGNGAKGDLGMLVRLCATPWPLPFGAVENRRSMVAITNLIDALCFLATTQTAGGRSEIFHVGDAEPLSIRRIVATIRAGMGKPAKLVSVPTGLLNALLRTAGLGSVAEKLLGDLLVDCSSLTALGWRPPVAPDADLRAMGQGFLKGRAAQAPQTA